MFPGTFFFPCTFCIQKVEKWLDIITEKTSIKESISFREIWIILDSFSFWKLQKRSVRHMKFNLLDKFCGSLMQFDASLWFFLILKPESVFIRVAAKKVVLCWVSYRDNLNLTYEVNFSRATIQNEYNSRLHQQGFRTITLLVVASLWPLSVPRTIHYYTSSISRDTWYISGFHYIQNISKPDTD